MYSIGIDLGGTKISSILMSADNEIVWRKRIETPSENYTAIVSEIAGLIDEARGSCSAGSDAPVGIGIPGDLASDLTTIKNANTIALIGKPLRADLQEKVSGRIEIANDATCFTASEAADGAAKGLDVVFGVIIGTGTGGGVAFHGKVHKGRNRIAGEWGHNSFPFFGEKPKGRPCYCGNTDCVETILSGPGLSLSYQDITGEQVPAHELEYRASNGDKAAEQVLQEYVDQLARALGVVVNILDPDAIVFGGGLSNLDRIYKDLPNALEKCLFNATEAPLNLQTKVLKNKWGDDSGVRGAAWLPRVI